MTLDDRLLPLAPANRAGLLINAVVFDMDGLLLDTESMARDALRVCGKSIGLDLPDCVLQLLIGLPADACHALLRDRFGKDVPTEALFEACAVRLVEQIDAGALQLKPGAVELLDRLEAVGVPSAVATSSSRQKALHRLQAGGIRERFEAVVTRDDVARGKPYPDLYLRAAAALGFAPHRCLALEESYHGVRAAHAAGMPVAMVPDLLQATDEMRAKCRVIVDDPHGIVPLFGPG